MTYECGEKVKIRVKGILLKKGVFFPSQTIHEALPSILYILEMSHA